MLLFIRGSNPRGTNQSVVSIQPLLLFIDRITWQSACSAGFNTTFVIVYLNVVHIGKQLPNVSIQPLLLFIIKRKLMLYVHGSFNTTFVIVYLVSAVLPKAIQCFNTTFVIVYLLYVPGIVCFSSGFNTTFVIVYRASMVVFAAGAVSIQPLLLFIIKKDLIRYFPLSFQYNLCYCLSKCKDGHEVRSY